MKSQKVKKQKTINATGKKKISGGRRFCLCVVGFIYSGVAGAAEGAINCY